MIADQRFSDFREGSGFVYTSETAVSKTWMREMLANDLELDACQRKETKSYPQVSAVIVIKLRSSLMYLRQASSQISFAFAWTVQTSCGVSSLLIAGNKFAVFIFESDVKRLAETANVCLILMHSLFPSWTKTFEVETMVWEPLQVGTKRDSVQRFGPCN